MSIEAKLTRDPKLVYSAEGKTMCVISVETTDGEKDLMIYGSLGKTCYSSLIKGCRVSVTYDEHVVSEIKFLGRPKRVYQDE